jgi:iron complex transport system substrate-binding protein
MRSRLGMTAAATLALTGLAACGTGTGTTPAAAGGDPVTVENCGRQVTVDAPPQRIMVIGG